MVRTLEEEIGRVVRGRVVNPKWIAGVMRHGYKGAFEIAATVDYMFAFAATTGAVGNHHFDALYEAYLADETVRAFLAENNPAALADIAARFREAVDRGLWTPRAATSAMSRPRRAQPKGCRVMTSRTGRCLLWRRALSLQGRGSVAGALPLRKLPAQYVLAGTTFFAVPTDGFAFEGEQPGAYASSPGVIRRFCRTCGTPMSFERVSKPEEIHLYAASLDDADGFVPELHSFWSERVPWLSIVDDLPKHED